MEGQMSFHAGQRVICVEDGPIARADTPPGTPSGLCKGCIYTVAAVIYRDDTRTDACLLLREVQPYRKGACWGATRFRPVRRTDISVFTRLLEHERGGA